MSIYRPEVSAQDRYRIIQEREEWLAYIEEIMDEVGQLEVTRACMWKFDDPPYSPVLTVALLFGGHREPETVTAMSALRDLAAKHGWDMGEDILGEERNIHLVARIKRWPCPSCNGSGRQPTIMRPYNSALPLDLGAMTERYCSQCRGQTTIESRTNPEREICRIVYHPFANAFVPADMWNNKTR